ncbi:hypothetical protein M0804_007993 [Polistes exclamans]|nr:hypothetical protein M0804_007993 [Polistes exclamans]
MLRSSKRHRTLSIRELVCGNRPVRSRIYFRSVVVVTAVATSLIVFRSIWHQEKELQSDSNEEEKEEKVVKVVEEEEEEEKCNTHSRMKVSARHSLLVVRKMWQNFEYKMGGIGKFS